jgi:hypothetical protein
MSAPKKNSKKIPSRIPQLSRIIENYEDPMILAMFVIRDAGPEAMRDACKYLSREADAVEEAEREGANDGTVISRSGTALPA